MRSNCQPNFFSSWDYENQVEDTTGCSSFGLVFDLWLDSYAAVTESPLQRLQTKIVFSTSRMVMSISKEFCFMLVIWFLAACRSNFQKKNMPAIFLSKLNSIANWIYGHCCLSIILQSRAWFFASFVFHSRTKKLDWLVFLDLEKYLYLKFVIEFINSKFKLC